MAINILPEELKSYKLPRVKEGSARFFSLNPAADWNLIKYYQETHDNNKKYALIIKDYCLDLNWIAQMSEVPKSIRTYAGILIKEKKVNSFRPGLFLKNLPFLYYSHPKPS